MKEEFYKHRDLIYKLSEESQYPQTAKLLLRFFEKIESISTVVVGLEKRTDIYPCMILVRSQIEHLMVIYYIWMKNRIDKNDQTAIDYFENYKASELLKRENYKISIEKINDKGFNETLKDRLIKHDESIKDLNDSILNQIHQNANQFKIRKITDYIVNDTLEGDRFALKDKMIKFLKGYNLISSFTHGGPTADSLFFNDIEKIKYSDKLEEYKSWSAGIIYALIILIFWFFGEIDEKIEQQLKSKTDKQ